MTFSFINDKLTLLFVHLVHTNYLNIDETNSRAYREESTMQKFTMSNVFSKKMYGFLNRFSGILIVLAFTSGIFNFFALLFSSKDFFALATIVFLFGISSIALAFEKPANAKVATYNYTLTSNTLSEKKFSFWTLVCAIAFSLLTLVLSIISIASNVPYVAFNFPQTTNWFFIILYIVVVALYVIFPFFVLLSLIYLALHLLEVISALANKDVDENWNKSVKYIKAYIVDKANLSDTELSETSLDSIKSDIFNLLNKCDAYKMLPRTLQLDLVLLAYEKVCNSYLKKLLDLHMLAISITEFPDLDNTDKTKKQS